MNGLFYLDEIFYSENSPYFYDIDTFSSINQLKPIKTMDLREYMLDSWLQGRLWDKQVMMDFINAALYDEREVMRFLLYLSYDLPSRREGPGVEIRLLSVYGIYLLDFSLPEFPSWRMDVVLANEQTGKTFGRIRLWSPNLRGFPWRRWMTLRTLSARRRLRIRSGWCGLMVLIESESDKYSMTDKGQAYTSLPLLSL